MENNETDSIQSVEQALTELQKSPDTPVRAKLREFDVEIRVINRRKRHGRLGDMLASIGPWSGESAEELSDFLAQIPHRAPTRVEFS